MMSKLAADAPRFFISNSSRAATWRSVCPIRTVRRVAVNAVSATAIARRVAATHDEVVPRALGREADLGEALLQEGGDLALAMARGGDAHDLAQQLTSVERHSGPGSARARGSVHRDFGRLLRQRRVLVGRRDGVPR